MKLPVLKIGDLTAEVPIIQGGMAIRLSTARLAAAVAQEGGIDSSQRPAWRLTSCVKRSGWPESLPAEGIIGINAGCGPRISWANYHCCRRKN
ncbi:MAG: hypothetical protein ACLR2G_12405 [Phascolarctobacterium faecium]